MREDIPTDHWIIVGEVPHAYISTDDAANPLEALDSYVGVISDWVEAVRADEDLSEVYPVVVPRSCDLNAYADQVAAQLDRIDREILAEESLS